MLSKLGLVLSPLAYGVSRLAARKDLLNVSRKLDPRYSRTLEELAVARGCDSTLVNRFSLALELIASLKPGGEALVTRVFSDSKSQLLQDVFAVVAHAERRDGYFVEVGVGSGVSISNTYLLETNYGWSGVLVEPNRSYREPIMKSRKAALDVRAAYNSSVRMEFTEDESIGEFSSLSTTVASNVQGHARKTYEVTTARLDDILAEHGAPDRIGYMSIDTEGSEMEVLEGLDLAKRRVDAFTIEHNFNADKLGRITAHLTRHGYRRVLADVTRWDAWYVHKDLKSELKAGSFLDC